MRPKLDLRLALSFTILISSIVLSHQSRPLHPLQDGNHTLQLSSIFPPSQSPFHLKLRATPPMTYRWSGGWTMTVSPGPAILPVESGAAMLSAFYDQAMAVTAAHMLHSHNGLSGIDFENEIFSLYYRMIDRGPANAVLDWGVVYWFAAYMQGLVRRGYTHTGRVLWRHESGIIIGITLRLLVDVTLRRGSGS